MASSFLYEEKGNALKLSSTAYSYPEVKQFCRLCSILTGSWKFEWNRVVILDIGYIAPIKSYWLLIMQFLCWSLRLALINWKKNQFTLLVLILIIQMHGVLHLLCLMLYINQGYRRNQFLNEKFQFSFLFGYNYAKKSSFGQLICLSILQKELWYIRAVQMSSQIILPCSFDPEICEMMSDLCHWSFF